MRKLILLVFVVIFIITLTGCDNTKMPVSNNDQAFVSDDKEELINIIDLSSVLNIGLSDTEEPFYEDYSHIYSFSNPISRYVIVQYANKSIQNVKEALKDGNITIADLDAFGMKYYAKPKLIENIIDLTKGGDLATDTALEGFYRDENYTYLFGSIKSQYVIVYYKDGTKQNVKDALADGKIKISDLDWFDIGYIKEPQKSQ